MKFHYNNHSTIKLFIELQSTHIIIIIHKFGILLTNKNYLCFKFFVQKYIHKRSVWYSSEKMMAFGTNHLFYVNFVTLCHIE